MTGSVTIDLVAALRQFGADEAALRLLDVDEPGLLPYATLLTARDSGDEDLQALGGIYEWQGTPLVFLVAADRLGEDEAKLQRIRRVLAMRGDAPYLGVVGPGRLDIYHISLDDRRTVEARVDVGVAAGQEVATLAHLANARPGLPTGHRQWISQVVLKLLGDSIDTLKTTCGVDDDDAISLVGRALFTRFLGDRHLLGSLGVDILATACLFDDAASAAKTSQWLDVTFNGDFLPTSSGIWERLPLDAFKVLGDILRRAPGGQLRLGWEERWDNLDFAHIPVGVLSQAYEHYLHRHAPVPRDNQDERACCLTEECSRME